ncbi:VanZ family protein [Methylosoma difficile]
MPTFINGLALGLYCALIFWLSSKTQLPAPSLFEHQDKLQHFLAYAVMAVLAWRTFGGFNLSRLDLLIASVVFCSVYGISDEWHQSFVPGRDVSGWDWLADNTGSLFAGLCLYRFSKKKI